MCRPSFIMWLLLLLIHLCRMTNFFERCIFSEENGLTYHLTCIHGICEQDSNANGRCTCAYGYYGNECSIPNRCLKYPEEDDCMSYSLLPNPCNKDVRCLNGGFCEISPSSSLDKRLAMEENVKTTQLKMRCVCPVGFHGDFCERKVNNSCLKCDATNTETCTVAENSGDSIGVLVKCQCRQGFYGPFCQFINETSMVHCKNQSQDHPECVPGKPDLSADFCCQGEDCDFYCRNSATRNLSKKDSCPERVCPSVSYTFMPRCPRASFCQLKFGDGFCDADCNQEFCLYDGGDCNVINPCLEKEFCLLSDPLQVDSFQKGCDSKICHNMSCVYHSDNFCFEHHLLRQQWIDFKMKKVLVLVFLGDKSEYLKNEYEILRAIGKVINLMIPHVARHSNGSDWIQEGLYEPSFTYPDALENYPIPSSNHKIVNKPRGSGSSSSRFGERVGRSVYSKRIGNAGTETGKARRIVSVGYNLDPSQCIGVPCVSEPYMAAESLMHVGEKRNIFPMAIVTAKVVEEIDFNYILICQYALMVILVGFLFPLMASSRIRRWTKKHTWYPAKYQPVKEKTGGCMPSELATINVKEEKHSSSGSVEMVSLHDTTSVSQQSRDVAHNISISNPCDYRPHLIANVAGVTFDELETGFHPLFYLYYHNQLCGPRDILPYVNFINRPIGRRGISILMCAVTSTCDYQSVMEEMIVQAVNSSSMFFTEFSSKLLRDSKSTTNSSPDRFNLVKLLLDFGADVKLASSDTGETALHFACKNADLPVIRLLLSCGAFVNHRDFQGRAPLHVAASNCFQDTVKMLLENPSINVNQRDFGGMTALMDCCCRSLPFLVKLLLKSGDIDVNVQNEQSMTALHLAASIGNFEICHLLLQSGASCSLVDCQGRTPSILAKMNGHNEVFKLLNAKTSAF